MTSHYIKLDYTMPYDTMSCHKAYYAIPYHGILYYAMPYYAIQYHTLLCDTMPYHTIPCHAILCYIIPYQRTVRYHTISKILCGTMPFHAIPYYTMPYCATPYHTMPMMPCHTMSCSAIPYHTIPYLTPKQRVHGERLTMLLPVDQVSPEVQEDSRVRHHPWQLDLCKKCTSQQMTLRNMGIRVM